MAQTLEKRLQIMRALEKHRWRENKTGAVNKAAAELGISEMTIWRFIKNLPTFEPELRDVMAGPEKTDLERRCKEMLRANADTNPAATAMIEMINEGLTFKQLQALEQELLKARDESHEEGKK